MQRGGGIMTMEAVNMKGSRIKSKEAAPLEGLTTPFQTEANREGQDQANKAGVERRAEESRDRIERGGRERSNTH
jgi:hypothetical protein